MRSPASFYYKKRKVGKAEEKKVTDGTQKRNGQKSGMFNLNYLTTHTFKWPKNSQKISFIWGVSEISHRDSSSTNY